MKAISPYSQHIIVHQDHQKKYGAFMRKMGQLVGSQSQTATVEKWGKDVKVNSDSGTNTSYISILIRIVLTGRQLIV